MKLYRTALLERESELALIGDRLAATPRDGGGVVIVRGPMGTGKTRLLEAVEERAADEGLRVLRARAGEFEQAFSFGLVRQLLAPVLQTLSSAEQEELLSGAARLSARVVLEPDLDAPAESYAVMHGLYWLCIEIGVRTPLLLTVDDAHWGDPASLRWLNYLARRVAGVPIAVVVAGRTPAAPQLHPLAALESQPDVEVLELGGLSAAAVRDLLERALGAQLSEEVSQSATHATGGNPLLVEALAQVLETTTDDPLKAIEDAGPVAVARQIRERPAALGADVVAFATALAVLGPVATEEYASALSELPGEVGGACRDTLFRAGLVGQGLPVAFVHPLIRSAVLTGLEPSRRSRLHRSAADILAANGASLDVVAVHLLHVEPASDPSVTRRLREAARAARGAGAPESAATYLRRALGECSEAETTDVLQELGEAEAHAGLPEAADRLRAARERTTEPARRTRLALLEAGTRAARAETGPALALLDATLKDPETTDPDLRAHLEASLVALAGVDISSRPGLLDRVERVRSAEPAGSDSAVRVLSAAISMENVVRDDVERALRLARCALEGGHLFRELPLEAPPITLAINALAFSDAYDDALAAWEHVFRTARAEGSALAFGVASTFRGLVRLRTGDLKGAEADARSGQQVLTELGAAVPASIALGTMLMALAERGELEEAELALTAWPIDPFAPPFGYLLFARGQLRFAQGRWGEAARDFETYGHRTDQWRMGGSAVFTWRAHAALAYRRLGDLPKARALAHAELERAEAARTLRARGLAAHAAALVEGGDAGRELLERSVGLLRECGARVEHARALIDHGAALRRLGQRQAAQNQLRSGLDLADRCDARPLAERARQELRAAGARPRRARLRGVDALTASELRVARMAASGMTNREIAQDLFVTLKAVEKHLSSTYGKLQIAARNELSRALTEPQ